MRARVLAAIDRALDWLQAEMQPDGEFRTYWSERLELQPREHCDSPFIGAVVLWALLSAGVLESPRLAHVRARGLGYLLKWRREDGFVHFLKTGIAADLDDTCIVNLLLLRANPQGFDHRALTRRVLSMRDADGSFPTWVGASNPAEDTDPVVVANVLRYLDALGHSPAASERWLREVLEKWTFAHGTRYYVSPFAPHFFAAQLSSGLRKRVLGSDPRPLLHRLQPWLGEAAGRLSPLDTLYLFSLLTRLGLARYARGAPGSLLESVLAQQQPAGCWPGYAAFQAYNYWGGESYGTALAVLGLCQYLNSPDGLEW
jgi:hypothetical protein